VVRGDLIVLAERAEHEATGQQYRNACELLPDPAQAEISVGGGSARYFGSRLPVSNKAVGLTDAVISDGDLERLTAFYHERGAPARTVASERSDPTIAARLEAAGYRVAERQHGLIGELHGLAGAYDSRVRIAIDLDAWASVAAGSWLDADLALCAIWGAILGAGDGVVPLELTEDGRIAAVAAANAAGEMGTLFFGNTMPWARNRGLQTALIRHRIKLLQDAGCRYVRATVAPDGSSERNARAAGLRLVYDRALWELPC